MGRIVIVSSWTHDLSYCMNSCFITDEKHKTVVPQDDPQALAKTPGKDAEGDEYKADMRRYGMSKTLMITFMCHCQSNLTTAKFISGTSFSVVSQTLSTLIFQSLPSIREQ